MTPAKLQRIKMRRRYIKWRLSKQFLPWFEQQMERQKRRCYYCYQKIVTDPANYQIDHKVPIYKGGNNALRNLCIACRGCNQYKSYHQMSQTKTARRLARAQEHREQAVVNAKQMGAFLDAQFFALIDREP